MKVIHFTKDDLNEEFPWHSTISRTRALFGVSTVGERRRQTNMY